MPFSHIIESNESSQVGVVNWNDDNFIFLPIHRISKQCLIIDPGESKQTADFIQRHQLSPLAVICTHHHPDHTDGSAFLSKNFSVPVYCSHYDRERLASAHQSLPQEGTWNLGPFQFSILEVPGHTLGHVALFDGRNDWLFSGDTLFLYGCGRLFEGTPAQMVQSLNKLRQLPPRTQIFCGHEYTLSNLLFAASLEPENAALMATIAAVKHKITHERMTIPGLLSDECRLNPFMRFDDVQLKQATGKQQLDDNEFFSYLRQQKNAFVAPKS